MPEGDVAALRRDPVLVRADRLADDGRFAEAIATLQEANRSDRTDDRERSLLALRHRAAAGIDGAGGRTTWPPDVDDIFVGSGMPEIEAASLDGVRLGSALVHHGCLLVRGLLPDRWVARLVAGIDQAVDGYDQVGAGAPVESVAPWYVPFECGDPSLPMGRVFTRHGGGVLAADSPPAMFDLIEALGDTAAPEAISAYFGEWPALSVKKTTLRRTPPDARPGWHQDGSFLDDSERLRTVNVWLALSDCGVDAPGLDVVPRQLGEVLRVHTGSPESDFTEGMKLLDATAAGVTERPRFHAGDAMLFDHLTLHQTGVHPDMTRTRYAIEAWFFAPSVYPAGQLFMAF